MSASCQARSFAATARLVDEPTASRAFALSLAMAAALATKVQALALLALVPLIGLVYWRRIWTAPERSRLLASLAAGPLVVVAVIDLLYLHVPESPASKRWATEASGVLVGP